MFDLFNINLINVISFLRFSLYDTDDVSHYSFIFYKHRFCTIHISKYIFIYLADAGLEFQ